MARLMTWYGDKPAGFCTILSPNRDVLRYAASWELRVIVCIISLAMFTSQIKALNVPSGKDVTTMESPVTGSGKISGQLKDAGVILKDSEKKTGSDKPNRAEPQHGLRTNSEKDVRGNDKSDILLGRRDKKMDEMHKKENLSLSEQDVGGSLNTWEQLWNEEVIPTDLDSPIDVDDYYTYDYFDDEDGGVYEDADTGGPSIERSKKDTSSAPQSNSQTLDRLADIVTGANAPMALVNLGTPNPDIEITIEVVNDDDVRQDGVVISMDLRDDAPMSPERGNTDALEGNNGGRGKGKGKNDRPARPTIKTDVEDSIRDEPDWSSFEFAPFLVGIPVPTGDGFDAENAEEKKGTWTGWSSCSASCGGGRSERSRSCGFSCTATESRDCNQQSCPRHGKSEARTETVSDETPQLPTLNAEYLDIVLAPENFDVDSCEEWMGCRSETLLSYLARLQDLPNCPCLYPTNIRQNNAIWDRQKHRMFHWKDASGDDKLAVYKPTATYCIISMLSPPSTSLASQQCCYDDNHRLITRGPGAGTPQLISAEISPELHYKIDVMPWIICKGDWTKYNKVRHPNNMWECKENPLQADFYQLFQEAKNY